MRERVVESAGDPEVLAGKLRVLLDVAETLGHAPTFSEIRQAVEAQGVSLSRARWSYMVAGTGSLVKDERLLCALADFFDVPADFLTGDSEELPPVVAAQFELVRALRAARVKTYATRALGAVSPETLRVITRFLDEEITAARQSSARG